MFIKESDLFHRKEDAQSPTKKGSFDHLVPDSQRHVRYVCLWTLDHPAGADGAWPQGCVYLVSSPWKSKEECLHGEICFKNKGFFSKSLFLFHMYG